MKIKQQKTLWQPMANPEKFGQPVGWTKRIDYCRLINSIDLSILFSSFLHPFLKYPTNFPKVAHFFVAEFCRFIEH